MISNNFNIIDIELTPGINEFQSKNHWEIKKTIVFSHLSGHLHKNFFFINIDFGFKMYNAFKPHQDLISKYIFHFPEA